MEKLKRLQSGIEGLDALLKGGLAWDGATSSLSAARLNLRISASTAGLRIGA